MKRFGFFGPAESGAGVMMPAGHACVVSRAFDVPRAVVWRAWAEGERLAQWFGPRGTTTPMAKMRFRAGESAHYSMAGPDGREMWGKLVYREIVLREKIAWVNSFSDRRGGMSRHPFSATWPLQMLAEVTFAGDGGQTTLTIKWQPLEATDEECQTFESTQDSITGRWAEVFERLAKYLTESKHDL
jgi:uncharacterized protein YndB with AHSA1/START domain